MILNDTVEQMNSKEYKERLIAEYLQLKIRTEGLASMLKQYSLGTLSFKPVCTYALLNAQLKSMNRYAEFLEQRAKLESIDLSVPEVKVEEPKVEEPKEQKKTKTPKTPKAEVLSTPVESEEK